MTFYYRCTDCLTTVTTSEEVRSNERDRNGYTIHGTCGACEGRMEFMGQTEGRRFVNPMYLCPCDGRCTNALGPSCDCKCRGENHGKGLLVRVETDGGPIPRFLVPAGKALENVAAFQAVCDAFHAAYDAKYGEVIARKRAGEYISSWDHYMDACDMTRRYNQARALRTHKGRNGKISALTAQMTARAAVAA